LRSAGLDLDIILLDCPYTYPLQGTNINWAQLKEVEVFVMDSLDAEYGLIITDNTGGMQSDQAFYDRVMAYARAYDKTGSVPDFFVLMSWFLHPSKALPEDAPDGQYPMTKVGLELFNYLGGIYTPAGISGSGTDYHHNPLVHHRDRELVIDYDGPVHSVTVYNLMGHMVIARKESDIRKMSTGYMDPGLYLVVMQFEGGSISTKVYVQVP